MPHIHEKIDFTVEALIVYKNKILLRKHDKYKIWLTVGGHVELDEDPNQAVIREAKEEVGLNIKLVGARLVKIESDNNYQELIPPLFLNRHKINDQHEHVSLTFLTTADTDNFVENVQEEKSSQIRWFTKEELSDLQYGVTERIRCYAEKALEIIASTTP